MLYTLLLGAYDAYEQFVTETWKKTSFKFDSFILPKIKGGEMTAMLSNDYKLSHFYYFFNTFLTKIKILTTKNVIISINNISIIKLSSPKREYKLYLANKVDIFIRIG